MITSSDFKKWKTSNILFNVRVPDNELIRVKLHLETMIKNTRRRLQVREEQKSYLGDIAAEPSIIMEIEDLKLKLENLEIKYRENNWAIEEAEISPQAQEEIVRVYLQKFPTLDLTGKMLKKVPTRVFKMEHQLTKLKLGKNKILEISGEITNLSYLENLDLSNNQIVELPSQICFLRKLRKLNLVQNQLTVLPEDMGNLLNLEHLNITENQITSLPLSFRNLQNLKRTPQNPEPFKCDEEKIKFPSSSFFCG